MKKTLACFLISFASSAYAHNTAHYPQPNSKNWEPFVTGVIIGALTARPNVVYSQQIPVQQYIPQPIYNPPVVNFTVHPRHYHTQNCRYAESRDYYGNIVSFLQCN